MYAHMIEYNFERIQGLGTIMVTLFSTWPILSVAIGLGSLISSSRHLGKLSHLHA